MNQSTYSALFGSFFMFAIKCVFAAIDFADIKEVKED